MLIEKSAKLITTDLLNRPDTISVALFASITDSINQVPTVLDLIGDGSRVVMAGTNKNEIYCWKALDENGDGQADLLDNFPITISSLVSTPALAVSNANERGALVGL